MIINWFCNTEKINQNFENKVLFNKRQRLELENAIISAQNYKVGLKNNKNIELMAQDIRISIEFLDRVLGKTSVDEEILGKIFSKFCSNFEGVTFFSKFIWWKGRKFSKKFSTFWGSLMPSIFK